MSHTEVEFNENPRKNYVMGCTESAKWEFQQPFELCLKDDVWKEISRLYLTDPHDLVNFAKSSSDIEDMLLEMYPSLYFTKVFEHVAPLLEFKDIRVCRQVCRHWNKLAVIYLESVFDLSGSATPYKPQPNCTIIKGIRAIDRWKNEMNLRLINPVACRSFYFERRHPDEDEYNAFLRRSSEHLATWGHHTKNLTISDLRLFGFGFHVPIDAHRPEITIMDYLEFIHSCLHHVANLKVLSLSCLEYSTPTDPQIVQEWLEAHPFPPLPFLRHIDFDDLLTSELVWKGIVVAYQSQLESLRGKLGPCLSIPETRNLIALPRLTKLIIYLSWTEVSSLFKVAERSHWSLKYLHLILRDGGVLTMEHRMDFQNLLQHSGSTLESLQIITESTTGDQAVEEFFVNVTLPRLELFGIYNFDLHSLDFVVDFSPNLKTLKVYEKASYNLMTLTPRPQSSKVRSLYGPNEWRNLWTRLRFLDKIEIAWANGIYLEDDEENQDEDEEEIESRHGRMSYFLRSEIDFES